METVGDTHVYRPAKSYEQAGRILACGFVVVASTIGIAIIVSNARLTGQPPTVDAFIPLVFLGVVLVLALRPGARMPHRLVISPRGIEFHRSGLSIVSGWDNVKAIRMMYTSVLVLHRPAAMHRSLFSYQWNMTREIPLDIFDFDPYSAIAQDLRMFAPHLFKDDPPRRVRADVDDDDPWL